MKETHTQVSFLLENETFEEINGIVEELEKMGIKGIKNKLYNSFVQVGLDEFKISEELYDQKLNYYTSLDYTFIVRKVKIEENTCFYGKVAEIDECETTADTITDLFEKLEGIKNIYIENKLKSGDSIPVPFLEEAVLL